MPISSFGAAHVAAALAALTGAAVAAIGAALRLLSSAVTIAGAPLCSGSGSRLFVAAGSAELTRGLTAETRTGFQPMAGPASNRAPVTLENAPVPTYNTRRKLPFGCPVANGISRIQTGPNRFFTRVRVWSLATPGRALRRLCTPKSRAASQTPPEPIEERFAECLKSTEQRSQRFCPHGGRPALRCGLAVTRPARRRT